MPPCSPVATYLSIGYVQASIALVAPQLVREKLIRDRRSRGSNMEVHAAPAAAAKRAWSYLRAVFFMARKGVLSNKRKLFISVHLLLMKQRRRNKQAVANLMSHHHHHHHHGNALRRRDYEFSCSNSPDVPPGSFSHYSSSRRRLAYFPCLGAVVSEKEEEDVASSQPLGVRIEYYAGASPPAPGEEYSAASTPAPGACFSVRVSNYSSEDEGAGRSDDAVDHDAEEFIRRFYEQLRRQNQIAMLPCHLQESAA